MKQLAHMVAVAAVAFAGTAHAEEMFLKSKEVTVEGTGSIKDAGSEAAARDVAIKNAQRAAVEQVIGAMIESNFSSEMKETVKGKKNEFEAKVSDRVYSKSKGFIESQKIVKEKKDGDTIRISLLATVKAASLDEELIKLQELFRLARYPKIMVVIGERYTNKDGKKTWIDSPAAIPAIEEALLQRTFELMAKDQAEKLRKDSLDAFGDMLGDDKRVAEIASKYGADVAIAGSSEVKYSAYNEMGNKMHYVSSLITLRAVNVSTAKILASFDAVGKGFGANEDLARVRAIKDSAPELIDKLLTGIVRSWKKEADAGNRFHITIVKVKNYKKVARPLMKAMKKLNNVESVKEINYGGKRLEVEVIYKGTKEELLDGMLDDIGGQKKFRKIDKVMDKGDSFEFTL